MERGCTAGVFVEPERPEGPLVVSDVTNNSITLSWNPPLNLGGGSLTCYIIEARMIAHADIIKNIELVEPEQTSFVVEGLEADQVYVFRVYAENEAGMSAALILTTPIRIRKGIAATAYVRLGKCVGPNGLRSWLPPPPPRSLPGPQVSGPALPPELASVVWLSLVPLVSVKEGTAVWPGDIHWCSVKEVLL
ncbi:hypothetical protein Pmani_021427 [Petrolisthes manimaculis]|uniref:Fibronectin type-III domain-containing protein n=1 Tax=Petrolisthes manimaculis TaxID=1843537 RepID=A0AAE1U379_9EUCA|nr:hypothetical protein Pmani_021427 [Petrolisthes manimaculis]